MKKNRYVYKETLPIELPLSFSNHFLRHINLEKFSSKSLNQKYSIPLNFNVPKTNGTEARTLSLPHPIAQIQMMAYIDTYKYNIMNFCSLSPFSIRSPQKLNNLNYDYNEILNKRVQFFNSLFDEHSSELKINSADFKIEYMSFFSYKKFNNILQFKNSISYHRSKLRFDNYMNLDIQNFFSSIYTHSLEWAITDNIRKTKSELHGDDDFFRKITDKVCQTINYNETNGIIVGPEFSRIISEILLTRADLNIAKKLSNEGLQYNRDYIIYRFIDDYTIFFNNPCEQNEKIIKETIIDILSHYKLRLNTEKSVLKNSLLIDEDTSIIELNQFLVSFIDDFNKNFRFEVLNNLVSTFMIQFSKIITTHPTKKVTIVRYTLKKFKDLLPSNSHNISRQLILDLAFFVLSFSPEHFSVQNLNNLLFNYRNRIINEYKNDNRTLEIFDNEYVSRLSKFLKRNKSQLDQIYELITAAKFLTIKLPNTLLSTLLETKQFKYNYFILCTIANYILTPDNPYRLNKNYKIIFDKIIDILHEIIQDYSKDSMRFIESQYFYIINDFNYYPLLQKNRFSSNKSKDLNKKLTSEHNFFLDRAIKNLSEGFSITGKDNMIEFVKPVVSRSYYRWNLDHIFYVKNNILKSLNSYKNNPNFFNYN